MEMRLEIFIIKKCLGSNYICLAVTLIDFILKKMKIVILKCFKKNVNTLNNIVFFEGVIYIQLFLNKC